MTYEPSEDSRGYSTLYPLSEPTNRTVLSTPNQPVGHTLGWIKQEMKTAEPSKHIQHSCCLSDVAF